MEQRLTDRIVETLRELGPGFAFVGRQVHMQGGGERAKALRSPNSLLLPHSRGRRSAEATMTRCSAAVLLEEPLELVGDRG